MSINKTLIVASLATALGLIAGAPLALASERDDSPNAYQSELDALFARGHTGVTAKSAARAYAYAPNSGASAYAYAPAPKRPTARK